jgi:hypothetical protein
MAGEATHRATLPWQVALLSTFQWRGRFSSQELQAPGVLFASGRNDLMGRGLDEVAHIWGAWAQSRAPSSMREDTKFGAQPF